MKTKRILAIILLLSLVFSLAMPTVVFAGENDDEQQVELLEPLQKEEEPAEEEQGEDPAEEEQEEEPVEEEQEQEPAEDVQDEDPEQVEPDVDPSQDVDPVQGGQDVDPDQVNQDEDPDQVDLEVDPDQVDQNEDGQEPVEEELTGQNDELLVEEAEVLIEGAEEELPALNEGSVAPPEAVVTANSNLGPAVINGTEYELDAGYTFSIDEASIEPQLAVYGDWNCDFVVSFDKAVAAGTVGMYGQYGSYAPVSFLNPADIAAGAEIMLVREALGGDTTLNLNDIATLVRTFDCGVFNLSPENAGTTMTVELRIWNDAGEEECGTVEYTFEDIAVPQANVTENENLGPAAIDGTEYELDAGYNFSFNEGEPTTKQLAAYGDWNCDFVVSFDKAVAAGTVGMYGQYGEYAPVSFLNPADIAAGAEIMLVREALGGDTTLNLNDIATFVRTFDCGVFNLSPENAGTTMTVELRIWNDAGEEECGTVEYTFEDIAVPQANVTENENLGPAVIDGTEYELDAGYNFSFNEGEPTAKQLAVYGDWNCDFVVSFDKAVAAGTVGMYGQYGEYAPVSFLNPADIAAGAEIMLVREALGGDTTLNLNDIATFVRTFDCGVFNLSPENAGTTMTVELRIWNDAGEEECGTVEYTFEDIAVPEAVVTEVDDLGPAVLDGGDGTEYGLDAGFNFSFKEGEPTAAQLAVYGDWNCDFVISVDRDIAKETVVMYGVYELAGAHAFLNPEAVHPGEEIELVRAMGLDENLKFKDLYKFVGTFDCGVANLAIANAGTTMTVELRLWKDDQSIESAKVEYTFATIAPPEADVEEVDDLGPAAIDGTEYELDAGYNFSFNEGEPTTKQLAAYGDWNCDFVVSFDKAVAAGTVGLYGQYGDYDPVSFLNPADIAAEAEIMLVREALGGDTTLNLRDIATFVRTFDCGVFNLSPENAGTTMTVELRIWKDDQEFECAKVEYTFAAVAPPEAVVTEVDDLGPAVLDSDGKVYELDAGFNFSFKEGEPTAAQLAVYGDWNCDFVISVDREIAEETVVMYGVYELAGAHAFLNPEAVHPGEEIELIRAMGLDENLKFKDLYKFVGTFDCGVTNLSIDNAGTTMTVELRLWKDDQSIECAKVDYTFEAPNGPEAKVTPLDDLGPAVIDGTEYELDAGYNFTFDPEPDQDQIDFFGNWYADFVVYFDKDVAAETVGLYGQYGEYDPQAFLNPEDIAAGQKIMLVREAIQDPDAAFTLNDILTFVRSFDCGVFNLSPDNVGTTMTVELKIWDPEKEGISHICAKVDYTFEEKIYTVSVSSQDENGDPIGGVEGGGDYSVGAEVTVTALTVANYVFDGWFKNTESGLEAVSGNASYTFSVFADTDLVAKYHAAPGNANLHVYGDTFIVDGETYSGNPQDFSFPIGTVVTITSTQENFAYWVNISKNIVSKTKSFTFTIVADTTFTEYVYLDPEPDDVVASATLFFLNAYNQVISEGRYGTSDQIAFPNPPPKKMACTFLNWKIEETKEEATDASVKALMSDTETVVLHIRPVYERIDGNYTVNVKYDGETLYSKTLRVGLAFTVTKDDVASWSGGNVSADQITGWKIENQIVSRGDSYIAKSAVSDKVIDLVVLTDPAYTPEPVITIEEQFGTESNGKYNLSTTMYCNAPSGYTVHESGFVYSTNSRYEGHLDELIIDAPNTKKHIAQINEESVVYTLNLTTSNPEKVVYIRAFVTYEKSDGTIITAYTDPISSCYNTIE